MSDLSKRSTSSRAWISFALVDLIDPKTKMQATVLSWDSTINQVMEQDSQTASAWMNAPT